MIRRLPGFELIDVDDEVRGFTGSRGNVLFDGRPPAGKQESLEQILRRIPASRVLRIELIRGGTGGAATGGYDLVANVIRERGGSTSASALAGATAAPHIGVRPDARLELSREWDDRRFDGALAMETEVDDDSGSGEIVEREAGGALIERVGRDEREIQRRLSADGEFKTPLGASEMVANFSLLREKTREKIRSEEGDESEFADERERLWSGEGGAQFQTPIGNGTLETVFVQRIGRLKADAIEEDESFNEKTRTSESIGRTEYRREGERLQTFVSVEGAINRLSSDASLVVDGTQVPLSGSDVNVSERRAEGALGGIWKPNGSTTVEPSIRGEYSNIRSTGDSQQDDSFLFLKPRLRVAWDGGKNLLRATVEREVAQLDFNDFVATASLDRDEVSAGATSLRPPSTWSVSASYERRILGDGSLTLTLRREWISDVLDRVMVESDGELFDAVGNIGDGTRRIAQAEWTVPLDRLGVPGMQFRGNLTWLKGRVTDPVTGERRSISEDKPFEGELRLTHDLPGGRWSWGADAELAHHERQFRFDELRKESKATSVGAYLEFRPRSDWRLRFEAENFTSYRLKEVREEFDGPRSEAPLDSTETRKLKTSPIFSFSVRKSFGASGQD